MRGTLINYLQLLLVIRLKLRGGKIFFFLELLRDIIRFRKFIISGVRDVVRRSFINFLGTRIYFADIFS